MSTITHKRGASWRYVIDAELTDAATGDRLDMTGWTVESELRAATNGALIATFECTITDPLAQIYTHAAPDTTGWPVGRAVFDVVYRAPGGDVVATNTVQVMIAPLVTAVAA